LIIYLAILHPPPPPPFLPPGHAFRFPQNNGGIFALTTKVNAQFQHGNGFIGAMHAPL
jgi:hypothetical protein